MKPKDPPYFIRKDFRAPWEFWPFTHSTRARRGLLSAAELADLVGREVHVLSTGHRLRESRRIGVVERVKPNGKVVVYWENLGIRQHLEVFGRWGEVTLGETMTTELLVVAGASDPAWFRPLDPLRPWAR